MSLEQVKSLPMLDKDMIQHFASIVKCVYNATEVMRELFMSRSTMSNNCTSNVQQRPMYRQQNRICMIRAAAIQVPLEQVKWHMLLTDMCRWCLASTPGAPCKSTSVTWH